MGKYSNANFSPSKEADPMGVGVINLGRSSYDPIESVRQGWDTYRRQKLIRDERRQREYEAQIKSIPSYKDVNTRFANEYNDKLMKMGRLAKKGYDAGIFRPWAQGEAIDENGDRMRLNQELSGIEKEIVDSGPLVNQATDTYKKAYDILNDPEKSKDLDMDVSLKNMQEYANAPLGEMQRLAPRLLVKKPTDVDINAMVKQNLSTYYKPTEESKTAIDPTTGNYLIKTTTKQDTAAAAEAMRKIYRGALLEEQNGINARYNKAPENEKVTKDGVAIPVEDWFAAEHVPALKDVLKIKSIGKPPKPTTSEKKQAEFISSLPKRDANGDFDLTGFSGLDAFYTTPKEVGSEQSPEEFRHVASFPLQDLITKTPLLANTPNTMDMEKGMAAAQGRSAINKLERILIYPVAKENIEIQGKEGGKKTIKAGEKITDADMQWLEENNALGKTMIEPFVVSAVSNRMVQKDKPEDYDTGSFTSTTIRPLREVRRELASAARAEGNDITPLYNVIDEIVAQQNQNEAAQIINAGKNKNLEEDYNQFFH